MGPACSGQGWRTWCGPAASLCALFPGEQVAGTEDAREGKSISARLLPGAATADPRGGRAGRSPSRAVRPRDRVRTGSVRLRAQEGRGGSTGRELGLSARAGRKDRERRPGWRAAECVSLRSAPRAGLEWRAGARARRPGACECPPSGRGDTEDLAGGRAGREAAPGGTAQCPRGARSAFPAASPGPHRRTGVGRGPASSTQSFQRHFQRVGREPLHAGARTEGRND